MHPLGVEGLDGRAHGDQGGGDVQRGGIAHVIGVRLEGQAQQGHRLAGQVPVQGRGHLAGHGLLARIIDRHRRLDQPNRRAGVRGGPHQGDRILGKAGTSVAGTGVQEFGADPLVQTDPPRDLLHIGSDGLAQVRHLVDEGDLHRQEGVGGIFDQL